MTEPLKPSVTYADLWQRIDNRANERARDENDDAYHIGRRDGFEEAVQLIDLLTGGDGEYRFSTDPARNCPTPIEMIQGIEGRARPPASDSTGAGNALREATLAEQWGILRPMITGMISDVECAVDGGGLGEGTDALSWEGACEARSAVEQMDAILAALSQPSPDDPAANKAGGLWYRRWRAAQDKLAALGEAATRLLPANVSLDNLAWPDSTILPLDVTLGDLRALREALALSNSKGSRGGQ